LQEAEWRQQQWQRIITQLYFILSSQEALGYSPAEKQNDALL